MAEQTKIEWTDATWNPVTGCTKADRGCDNCYAARLAATRLKNHPSRKGLARINSRGVAQFTGEVRFNEDWLDQPLRWRKPRMIFSVAHGDLFHPNVPDEWIDKIFAVMALCPQHIFQVLTKRPERMAEYLTRLADLGVSEASDKIAAAIEGDFCGYAFAASRQNNITIFGGGEPYISLKKWPLPNVWLGTSISDQDSANERVPHLLRCPAAVRFVSAEPLLGFVDLTAILCDGWGLYPLSGVRSDNSPPSGFSQGPSIDWVIVGGESGPNARPMHPDWARSVRNQCVRTGTPFFFKQWGEYKPASNVARNRPLLEFSDGWTVKRVGKSSAGRLLDGQEWSQLPEVTQ